MAGDIYTHIQWFFCEVDAWETAVSPFVWTVTKETKHGTKMLERLELFNSRQ